MSMVDWIPKDYKRLAVINDFNVYSDDVRTLAKGQWLNDNIITFILEMVFMELGTARQERTYLVHASMCELLKFDTDGSSFPVCFEGVDLTQKDIIIFILNDNNEADRVLGGSHWALLFFDRKANEFIYLDSLSSLSPGTFHGAQNMYKLFTKYNYLKTEVKPEFNVGHSAKQKNGYDCGMFVIEYGRAIMQIGAYNPQTLKDVVADNMSTSRDCWLNRIRELHQKQEQNFN